MAYAITETSRLASDVTVTKKNEGMVVGVGLALPETHDMTHINNQAGRPLPPGISRY